jgi:hypothetical protein
MTQRLVKRTDTCNTEERFWCLSAYSVSSDGGWAEDYQSNECPETAKFLTLERDEREAISLTRARIAGFGWTTFPWYAKATCIT